MITSKKNETSCKVCGHHAWQVIDTLTSGIWNKQNTELKRQVLSFPIGECQHCHHVQVFIPYTEAIFGALYFSNTQEPDMWCDTPIDEKSPYEEMSDFFAPYIDTNTHLVDFGAGAGATLKYIEKKYQSHALKLASVDFHDHIKSNTIEHLSANLNQLTQIQPHFSQRPINVAISTHVLEHIIEPVDFLRQISECLTDDGVIFVEVPDSSPDAFIENLGVTNLVHGQHIHYYTKDSLSLIADKAGLKIINQQQLTTGNIPRLLLLLKRTSTTTKVNTRPIAQSAKHAVEQRFLQYNRYLDILFKRVEKKLSQGEKIGLWGLGGDFYLLVQSYPAILQAIKAQKITLYDYELAGHTFAEQPIISSTLLETVETTIYITPIYAPTRERMTSLSQAWSTKIIDPY